MLAQPREQFLRDIMFSHVYQHRGQFGVYLRILNLPVPASWGPSARRAAAVHAAGLIASIRRCVCAHSVLRPQLRWQPAPPEPAALQRS